MNPAAGPPPSPEEWLARQSGVLARWDLISQALTTYTLAVLEGGSPSWPSSRRGRGS